MLASSPPPADDHCKAKATEAKAGWRRGGAIEKINPARVSWQNEMAEAAQLSWESVSQSELAIRVEGPCDDKRGKFSRFSQIKIPPRNRIKAQSTGTEHAASLYPFEKNTKHGMTELMTLLNIHHHLPCSE